MATTKVAHRSPSAGQGATAPQAEKHEEEQGAHRHIATLHLPFVTATAEFRVPDVHFPELPVHVPNRSDLRNAVSALRPMLPSPEQAAYLVGLGVLGVLELIEWPVALAIAVGAVIVRRPDGAQSADAEPDKSSQSMKPGKEVKPDKPGKASADK